MEPFDLIRPHRGDHRRQRRHRARHGARHGTGRRHDRGGRPRRRQEHRGCQTDPGGWRQGQCDPGRCAQGESCRALIADTMKAHGRLDILVNNAGMSIRKQPEQYTLAEWHTVMDSNLTSAFLCSHAAYPEMKKGGMGKIINIGSMMSIFGAPFATAYAASKGGMVQMTKSMATAWAKDNIQVNAILPGWIDTALTKRAREQIQGLTNRCSGARRPAAGAYPTTSPASRCSLPRRRPIS